MDEFSVGYNSHTKYVKNIMFKIQKFKFTNLNFNLGYLKCIKESFK